MFLRTSALLMIWMAQGSAPVAQTQAPITYDAFCKLAPDDKRTAFKQTPAENRAVLVRTQVERWRDANVAQLNAAQIEALKEMLAVITPEAYSGAPRTDEASARLRALEAKMMTLFSREENQAMQPTGPCIAKKPE